MKPSMKPSSMEEDETGMLEAAMSPEAEEWWSDATLWEEIVRKALDSAAKGVSRDDIVVTTFKEAADIVKQTVHWNDREPTLKEALKKLLQDVAKVELKHGFESVLKGNDKSDQKQYVKLLNELVKPKHLQELMFDAIKRDNIKTFDEWSSEIKRYSQLYRGLVLKASTGSGSKQSGPGDARQVQQQKHGEKHASESKATDGTPAAASTSNKKRPGPFKEPDGPPPNPCRHCGEMHWTFHCKLKPSTKPKDGSRPVTTKPVEKPKVTGKVASASDDLKQPVSYDGELLFQDTEVSFVVDSGASYSLTSEALAQSILAKDPMATRVKLNRTVHVEAADGTQFPADFKIVTSVTARFKDGELIPFPNLELIAVRGFKTREVLIGRDTLETMNVDVVSGLKSALRSAVGASSILKQRDTDSDVALHFAAKRAFVTPQSTLTVAVDDEVVAAPNNKQARQVEPQPEIHVPTTDKGLASSDTPAHPVSNVSDNQDVASDDITDSVVSDLDYDADFDEDDLTSILIRALRVHKLVLTPKAPEYMPEESATSDDDSDSELPEINDHDPAVVRAMLERELAAAEQQGLSKTAIRRLSDAFLDEKRLLDAFRSVLSHDPPARVEPVRVQVTENIHSLRRPATRRYTPEGSKAMAAIVARLEKFGYVRPNKFATIVSPAYPVRKGKYKPGAKLEDRYRLTVDLRAVNSATVPMRYPLPRLETFLSIVAGKKFFGTMDLFSGYWQLPLHEDSQQFFSILTDVGIWTPNRLIQGSRNAAGPFQAAVAEAIGDDLMNKACVLYIDDILIIGDTEEEFVDNWIRVVERLHAIPRNHQLASCVHSTIR
jgi:hypothetical protein